MDDITHALNKRKTAFLNNIETTVYSYIVSQGKQCIAIVEKDSKGKILRKWECHLDDDLGSFCKVLFRFTRHHKHNGHDLDSALTEPITERVQKAYATFFEEESEAISSGMLTALAEDDVKLMSFLDRIADVTMTKFNSKIKKEVMKLVAHQIKESAQQGALHTIGQQVGHVATTAAGSQVAAVVGHMLVKLLAANITHIIAHLIATGFIQKLLAVALKKFIAAAVLGAVLKFLALHVGAAVGSSAVMWIVAPLLAAYIGYKVYTFPEKIGEEVSRSVRKELADKFESINRTTLEKIFNEVFGGNKLVQDIKGDEEFVDMLNKLGRKLESSDDDFSVQGRPTVSVREIYA